LESDEDARPALEALKCAGPGPATIFFAATGRGELTPEQQAHVKQCPVCQRWAALARASAADVTNARKTHPPLPIVIRLRDVLLRRWRITSSVAAAVAVWAAILFVTHTSSVRAALAAGRVLARTETPVGFGLYLDRLPLPAEAAAARAEALQRVQVAREELENAKAAAWQGPPNFNNAGIQATLEAYTRTYRPLRNVGEWDAALAVVAEALEFARGKNPANEPTDNWVAVYLDDLGSIYVGMGEYQKAREAYEESIETRVRLVKQGTENKYRTTAEDYRQAWRAMGYADVVLPLRWRVSYLAKLEGDLDSAWQQLAEGGAYLRDYFVGVCEAAGVPELETWRRLPAEQIPLVVVYRATPSEFQYPRPDSNYSREELAELARRYRGFVPSPGLVSKLREHLYHEARLRRVGGDFQGARQVLQEASGLPYFPLAAETRLDFYEPLESARIAILLGDYQSALAHVRAAEQHAGAVPLKDASGKEVTKPPIGLLPQAELKLLKAVALLGSSRDRAAAQELIREAMAVRDSFADRLSGEPRGRFLRQFETWDELARLVR
jgi:tetratricopeptide (TPR) repeat protein